MERIHTALRWKESTTVETIRRLSSRWPGLSCMVYKARQRCFMSAKQSQSEQPKQSKVVTCPQIQQSKPKLSHVCKARHGCHMSATRSKTKQLQQHKVVTCPTFKQHNSVTGPQSKAKLSHIREAQLSNSSKAKLTHVGKAGRIRHMSDK